MYFDNAWRHFSHEDEAANMTTTLESQKDDKYTVRDCDIIYLPADSIEELRTAYHYEQLPQFLQELIKKEARSVDWQLIQRHPSLFSWTDDCGYFLRPNVPKYDNDVPFGDLPIRWRTHRKGLQLVAWWVHPFLLPTLLNPIRVQAAHNLANTRICEIERISGIPFLASPFDLTPNHLPSLFSLRRHVMHELEQVYGVDDCHGAGLYFHTYNLPECAVLHLQVRVNYPLHPAEGSRTFYLDQVIEWLSSGHRFVDCLSEENRRAYFFGNENPELMKYLDHIPGSVALHQRLNPFYCSVSE